MSATVYDSLGRTVMSGPVLPSQPFLASGAPNWLMDTATPAHALVSTTVYDDAGQVSSSKDALGRVSSTTFDDLGRTKTSTDALLHTTQYGYDDDGRQLWVLDANQHKTSYDYDNAGRLITTHYPDGVSTSITDYDELGRRIKQTDQAGHATRYDYDTLGRLFTVTDPMLHVTQFGYDALGEKISQQDANGHTTYFSYDNRGRLVSKTLPGGLSDSRTYDGLGRLATMTDFNGKVTGFGYDLPTGRLLSKTAYANAAAYASNTPTGESVSFTYNLLDGSRRTATRTMPGGTSITTTYAYYGYDAGGNPTPDFRQGQLRSITTTASGGPARIISYDYDILGNKTAMQTPSGKTVGYGYDTLNRLMTVTHYDGATTTFGYDKVGNRQSVTRTNAAGTVFSTTTYTYDTLNRLTDIVNNNGSNGLVSKYHYGLRLDGKRSSVTDSGPATTGGTTNYTYDDQGKLTLEAGPYATIAYGYDNVGNRLTRAVTNAATGNGTTLVNGATINTYDLNDRIATVNGSVTHTYDADGNETTVNGQAASYDFENHLVSLGSVANYVYDADGNRYSAANLGTTTSYVVDTSLPYGCVVEEYAGASTAPSARYDYGDDLIRVDHATVASYYLFDGIGSTRQLVNLSSTVTDSYGYSAFGELASHTGSTANPFLFNAQQFDQASGDYYLRARYYDQSNGRFISQDPYGGSNGDPVSLHRYLYANDDPLGYHDPSGRAGEITETSFASTVSAFLASTLGQRVVGGVFGALAGAGDAFISGGNVFNAALMGGVAGALLGPAAVKYRVLFGLGGVGLSAVGVYQALLEEDYDLALYRGGLGLLGVVGVIGNVQAAEDSNVINVALKELRWTQKTAGGGPKIDGVSRADFLRASIKQNGYQGSPIDVVRTPSGYVTVDHTRAAVALELGMETVPATVHEPSDLLPDSMIGRFQSKAGEIAKTWGEAAAFRASRQSPSLPPDGSPNPPKLPPPGQ